MVEGDCCLLLEEDLEKHSRFYYISILIRYIFVDTVQWLHENEGEKKSSYLCVA